MLDAFIIERIRRERESRERGRAPLRIHVPQDIPHVNDLERDRDPKKPEPGRRGTTVIDYDV